LGKLIDDLRRVPDDLAFLFGGGDQRIIRKSRVADETGGYSGDPCMCVTNHFDFLPKSAFTPSI
jgi:hypothetical protein